jgi:hypothetical protein
VPPDPDHNNSNDTGRDVRRRPRRRLLRWLLPATVGLLAAAAAVLVLAYPSVAATACPRCFGMSEVAPGIYTDPATTPAQTRTLTEMVGSARWQVSEFYGGQQSAPPVLACFDDACYERIGGGRERGIAVLNRAVMLSPRGIDVEILAHEMSHVEIHRRLDGAPIPQWFDEGLAVAVADDHRYLAPAGSADRCLAHPDGPLPVSLDDWLTAASADADEYAKAACAVSRWLADYGSPREATTTLVDRLRSGETFTDVVR